VIDGAQGGVSMKTIFSFFGLMSVLSWCAVGHAEQITYTGTFQTPDVTGTQCDGLIDSSNYTITHTLTGSSDTTSIMHFASSNQTFLNGQTVIGLYDWNDDFDDDTTTSQGNYNYKINAQGLSNGQLLLAQVTIEMDDSSGNKICTTEAQIYGTPVN
jgi:hypothetical protein